MRLFLCDVALAANVDFDPYAPQGIDTLIDAWVPLTFAVNSINRSMGQADLYPFVLSPEIIGKLGYISARSAARMEKTHV
jgi:hypothetical protein